MRVARGLPRARQLELLRLLDPLLNQLDSEPVFEVGDPRKRQTQTGIARSTLAHVCQYLSRNPDRTALEIYLSKLEKLDFATGQNLNNPSGQHLALKSILQKFLKRNTQLSGEDFFYLFSCARRFLHDQDRRVEGRAKSPEVEIVPAPAPGAGAFKAAFAKARAQQSHPNGPPEEDEES